MATLTVVTESQNRSRRTTEAVTDSHNIQPNRSSQIGELWKCKHEILKKADHWNLRPNPSARHCRSLIVASRSERNHFPRCNPHPHRDLHWFTDSPEFATKNSDAIRRRRRWIPTLLADQIREKERVILGVRPVNICLDLVCYRMVPNVGARQVKERETSEGERESVIVDGRIRMLLERL